MRMLAVAARREPGSVPGLLPDAFPWARSLPEPDLHAFAVELTDALSIADPADDSASVAQLLIAWRHTAQAHSDPELLAALTRSHEEDRGPVPDPRDVVA
ncbi:hypothetical protein AB0O01_07805 [Streptomyces sp. NPDC093252]|uniref:hypothetical protein n=1 Tax=Streptomyces sp. NPDC093252 TaxID=3154980 RepID=UPI00342F8E53